MADGIGYSPADLRLADEAELHLIVQRAVMGTGRRSVHPGDKIMAAYVATMVVRAICDTNHVILRAPPKDSNLSFGHLYPRPGEPS
jgi:hypothetical protein